MEFEAELFGADAAARKAAVAHLVKSRGSEGLAELLEKILEHIYALENP